MLYEDLILAIGRKVLRMMATKHTPCRFEPEDWGQDAALAAWDLTLSATVEAEPTAVFSQAWKQLCGCRDDAVGRATTRLEVPGIEVVYAQTPYHEAVANEGFKKLKRAANRGVGRRAVDKVIGPGQLAGGLGKVVRWTSAAKKTTTSPTGNSPPATASPPA